MFVVAASERCSCHAKRRHDATWAARALCARHLVQENNRSQSLEVRIGQVGPLARTRRAYRMQSEGLQCTVRKRYRFRLAGGRATRRQCICEKQPIDAPFCAVVKVRAPK